MSAGSSTEWPSAKAIRDGGARPRSAKLAARGVVPGLAVVLVGEDPASKAYVGQQGEGVQRGGHALGQDHARPATTSEAELLAIVDQLNADPAVHGILVQLPLPKHIDTEKVLNRVDPAKDVDGFHPVNVGKLVIGDPTALRPCTPVRRAADADPLGHRDQGRARRRSSGGAPSWASRWRTCSSSRARAATRRSPSATRSTRDLPAVCRSADILDRGDRQGRVRHRATW